MENVPPRDGSLPRFPRVADSSLAAQERLDSAVLQSRQGGAMGFEALCRHVVGDRTYSDSTRAVFAELLEQVRSTLGRG